MPHVLYVLLLLISLYLGIHLTDFHQIFIVGRYLILDYRSDPLFRCLKGRCHGNQFWGQIGKIGLFTYIRSSGIAKRIAISPF